MVYKPWSWNRGPGLSNEVYSQQLYSPVRLENSFKDEDDMVYTRVKPLCLFKDVSKPSVLLFNKMMTFAIGLTVKLLRTSQITANTYTEYPLQMIWSL